jgi:hypothetical protein
LIEQLPPSPSKIGSLPSKLSPRSHFYEQT